MQSRLLFLSLCVTMVAARPTSVEDGQLTSKDPSALVVNVDAAPKDAKDSNYAVEYKKLLKLVMTSPSVENWGEMVGEFHDNRRIPPNMRPPLLSPIEFPTNVDRFVRYVKDNHPEDYRPMGRPNSRRPYY
ncbi:hypothetical protein H4R33_000873 [Dimargaris cristalligena]|uniref:Uncharacterized protein n=1 Tax=Dimargaris cristalligena TaxID=215637 RepID=A0A4Q0A029_9FUNG|nr:hypothetical protein H4R33_000873 [Dimargaris cristalligena]RKP38592.1 hypothetical protein BJ085DRAFT_27968 [Dimargaris cristalligena]|eukprot:RKP38592.1 hypothetical protein BJ085DRAFT_27968 [Dimargaris cristalligena]